MGQVENINWANCKIVLMGKTIATVPVYYDQKRKTFRFDQKSCAKNLNLIKRLHARH